MGRIRKTNPNFWLKEDMAVALREILDGKTTTSRASKVYNIPRNYLYSRAIQVQNGELTIEEACLKNDGGKLLSDTQEKLLSDHILLLDSRLFKVKSKDIRYLANRIINDSSASFGLCKIQKTASYSWMNGFFERHPDLPANNFKFTHVDQISVDRGCLDKFFDTMETLRQKFNILTSNIYCLDEFGITSFLNQISRVFNTPTKKGVGSQFDEVLISSVCCSNAVGRFLPPSFVLPLMAKDDSILKRLPEGSQVEFHSNGQMQTEIFARWMQKFIEFSKPTHENPVLLLLDGTSSHTKSFEFFNIAHQNYVHLLSFPVKEVNRLHPLNCFFTELSTCYEVEVNEWSKSNFGKPVTYQDIARFFGAAFSKAAIGEIAVKGFRKTGIVPLDRTMHLHKMFQSSSNCIEQTPQVNQDKLLQGVFSNPPPDKPLLSVPTVETELNVNKTLLAMWGRRIQKELTDDISTKKRSNLVQNPVEVDEFRDYSRAAQSGPLAQPVDVVDSRDETLPFIQPEVVMIEDVIVKGEPMEYDVENECSSDTEETCEDMVPCTREEDKVNDDVSHQRKPVDEPSANESSFELANDLNEVCSAVTKRPNNDSFENIPKFVCPVCIFVFLEESDLSYHLATAHKDDTCKKTSTLVGWNGQQIPVEHFSSTNLPVVQMGQDVGVPKPPATTSPTKTTEWKKDNCVVSSSEMQMFSKNGASRPPSSNPNPSVQSHRAEPVVPSDSSSTAPPSPTEEDIFFTVLRKTLQTFPENKRQATKIKIMELLYSIATQKLDPMDAIDFVSVPNKR